MKKAKKFFASFRRAYLAISAIAFGGWLIYAIPRVISLTTAHVVSWWHSLATVIPTPM